MIELMLCILVVLGPFMYILMLATFHVIQTATLNDSGWGWCYYVCTWTKRHTIWINYKGSGDTSMARNTMIGKRVFLKSWVLFLDKISCVTCLPYTWVSEFVTGSLLILEFRWWECRVMGQWTHSQTQNDFFFCPWAFLPFDNSKALIITWQLSTWFKIINPECFLYESKTIKAQ